MESRGLKRMITGINCMIVHQVKELNEHLFGEWHFIVWQTHLRIVQQLHQERELIMIRPLEKIIMQIIISIYHFDGIVQVMRLIQQ